LLNTARRKYLSWFKHKPTVKNPPPIPVHRSSPTTERLLKETKEAVRPSKQPDKKS